MELFHRILKTASGEASDIHIKIGTPVMLRLHRELVAIEVIPPTDEWMSNVVKHIVPRT